MTRKRIGPLYAEIGEDRIKEIRNVVHYIPGETVKSFTERAIDREIQRYYQYKSQYRDGDTGENGNALTT